MRVGIAGAGIMGRLLASSLCEAGWAVSLFDQGKKINCSSVAAGLLTPIAELEKNELVIYQMGRAALLEYWPRLLAKLSTPVYFRCLGSILLAHSRDQAELSRFMQMITSKINQSTHCQPLNATDISRLEPAIAHFQHGYYFAEEGQIDNQMLLTALENDLRERKITWHTDTHVDAISPHVIATKNQTHHFDLVIDCRGLGATHLFKDLRAVRGELIWLHAPAIHITRPIRLMHPRYRIYIVPRPHDLYLVGASEIESDDDSAISVRTTLELLSAAYCVHTGFSEARMVHTATHCRPTLANHLPKIQYTDGLIAVNGLYRHGFLIAPTLLQDIMNWLSQGLSAIHYPQIWEKCA